MNLDEKIMNLPIKLVDLVTLLFLSLLAVIIIFIILQRNIKRYKLRNVKEPHSHICKSIPKELKKRILEKHQESHIYREPPQLFNSTYRNLPPQNTKSFVIRLKAFDTSKNLENALYDCGYKREIGTKFENFLIKLCDEERISINLTKIIKDFIFYYKWALNDPKVFGVDELREMNKTINKIINELTKIFQNESILQHKLDLNSDGDYNMDGKSAFYSYIKSKENVQQTSNDSNFNLRSLFHLNTYRQKKSSNNDKSTTNEAKSSKKTKLNADNKKHYEDTDFTNKVYEEEIYNENENNDEDMPLVLRKTKHNKNNDDGTGNFNPGFSKTSESNF